MKKLSDSELSKNDGGIIHQKVFFFSKHFGLIHLAVLRVLKHSSQNKKITSTSLHFLFHFSLLSTLYSSSCLFSCLASSLFFFILSLLLPCFFSLLLHLVSSLALLLLSSSSSCLFSCLASSLLSSLFSLLSSLAFLSCLVFSFLDFTCLSFSVSLCSCLSLSPCCVVCGVCRCGRGVVGGRDVCLVCVCVCVFVCCDTVKKREKTCVDSRTLPCVRSKRLRVCRHHTRVSTCARGAGIHGTF